MLGVIVALKAEPTHGRSGAHRQRPGGGGVPDATTPGRSLALSTMRDWWPPRPRAGFPQDLVLDLGLQVVQNCLRRRTNVVDCDQVFGNPPHQLILRWSRNRNPAG